MINGITWQVVFIPAGDPILKMPFDYTVGVTDWNTKTVYLSKDLIFQKAFLENVIRHEICHCIMFSYEIEMDLSDEECLCDILATFGNEVTILTDSVINEIYS